MIVLTSFSAKKNAGNIKNKTMTQTTENNILIAKFMGFTNEKNIGWYDNEMKMPKIVYDTQNGNCFNKLLFNESWDWLIPAVKKIMEYQHEKEDSELALIVRDALCDVSITGTYDAVVDFIKWYNQNKY